MPKFIIYLYNFTGADKRGHFVDIFKSTSNNCGWHRPSECVFMIPPIGWDCE